MGMQILESGSSNIEYLRQLLDYAASLILKLGAPIRDSDTKAAHQSLVDELSVAVSPNSESESAFAVSLVKGVRFIFEQIQVTSLTSCVPCIVVCFLCIGSTGFMGGVLG
jgi:hypothetical protein